MVASTPQPEPHEVLGVAKDADVETVRKAYRRLMRTAHPDHGGTAGMFRMVQAAYDQLKQARPSHARPSIEDEMDAFFGTFTQAPPRPDPSDERRRAEKERVDEEYRRRRRQAYLDHPDELWLAEFEARQGEEDRASRISEAEVIAGLREMIRRGIHQAIYPVPEFWIDDMAHAQDVSRQQDGYRLQIQRDIAEEQRAAAEAQRLEAEAARQARDQDLARREVALGPSFRPAARARRDLLALWMFRGAEARGTSSVRLYELRRQITQLRRWPVVVGLGIPGLAWAIFAIDVWLVSYSNTGLGSQSLAWNVLGATLILGWAPPLFAYRFQAGRVEPLLRRAAAGSPYRGEEADREEWLVAAEQAVKTTLSPSRSTPSPSVQTADRS